MKDNVFLILCKQVTMDLYVAYSEIGMSNMYFISDQKPEIDKPNVIHYSDDMMSELNFTNMHSQISVCSWDKAIYFLSTMNNKPSTNYWFVEDDCYLNGDTFTKHVDQMIDHHADLMLYGWYKIRGTHSWHNWFRNDECFEAHELRASINQIVRVSDSLIDKVIEFRNTHDKFVFHEILFASLAERHHMQVHVHEHCAHVDICALKHNSLIHKNYNNQSNKQIIQDLKLKQYTIVHPFKNWYN